MNPLRAFPSAAALVLAGMIPLAACREKQPETPRVPSSPPPATRPATQAAPAYTYRAASPDGIGKVYLGREIAQVMGHLAAGWLDRPDRESEERPEALLDAMGLRPGDVVADLGAGTGYFSLRLAGRLPRGRVFAVDIQPEMLEIIRGKARAAGVSNVETILGDTADPKLPAGGVDVVLLVDAYHEFDHPWEMMQAVVQALKPGGRVVLVEYRGEDPDVSIKPLHKMTEAQAVKEMAAIGLRHASTSGVLPQQHVMVFEKR